MTEVEASAAAALRYESARGTTAAASSRKIRSPRAGMHGLCALITTRPHGGSVSAVRDGRSYSEPVADLRAAIIGYGLAGRFFHAPLIAATPGLVIASVVTSSPERQALVSREHPDAEIRVSPAALWENAEDHDLVVVATPNEAHAPLAIEAIDCGLPVVVDKPLAMTSDEAEALISRSEQTSRLLTVFQNRRWDSDQLTLARLLAEDRLGTVLRYESRFERWRPSASAVSWRDSNSPERGGGQLLDLGSHLCRSVVGSVRSGDARLFRGRCSPRRARRR